MKTLFGILMRVLRENEGSCKSKCPECKETCIMGVHGTGGHGCGNGHSWN